MCIPKSLYHYVIYLKLTQYCKSTRLELKKLFHSSPIVYVFVCFAVDTEASLM